MGAVNTSLQREAESIFSDLGYAVTVQGGELRAERKWRTVQVTPMPDLDSIPTSGEFRCFVTWAEQVADLEHRIERLAPEYEWAIFGIREDEDYVCTRPAE